MWAVVCAMGLTIFATTTRSIVKNTGLKPGYREMMEEGAARRRMVHKLPAVLCVLGTCFFVAGLITTFVISPAQVEPARSPSLFTLPDGALLVMVLVLLAFPIISFCNLWKLYSLCAQLLMNNVD